MSSDLKCRAICGVSLALFNQTLNELRGENGFQNCRYLTNEDQLVIYLYKLKSALPFISIGAIFDIHYTTASSIFYHLIDSHFDIASEFLCWLTPEENKALMPESFKLHFPNVTSIIDASEIKIEKPGSVKARNLTWSEYKENHTVKFLIGIAPCGLINFISQGYGGRITGQFLINKKTCLIFSRDR